MTTSTWVLPARTRTRRAPRPIRSVVVPASSTWTGRSRDGRALTSWVASTSRVVSTATRMPRPSGTREDRATQLPPVAASRLARRSSSAASSPISWTASTSGARAATTEVSVPSLAR